MIYMRLSALTIQFGFEFLSKSMKSTRIQRRHFALGAATVLAVPGAGGIVGTQSMIKSAPDGQHCQKPEL